MVTTTTIKKAYKQTEVGVIPIDWNAVLLDTAAKRGSGHTPDKAHPEYWGGQIKWISLQDSNRLDRHYIFDTSAKITPAGIANSSAKMHQKGSVVLSRDAGVGKSTIMASDMAVSQHFIAWRCGPLLNNHYLYYWLQSNKPEFERIAMGNTIKTIGLPYFKKLFIPLPNITEQITIATVLSDTDTLIDHLEKLIAKKKAIRQGAIQQLLTGKKRLPGLSGTWIDEKLRDIANFLKGRGLSKSKIGNGGKYSCILYGELFTTYSQVIKEVKSKTNYKEGLSSIKGDILMPGSTTTVGIDLAVASALQQNDVLLGGDLIVIRKKKSNKYDSEFLANYLTHISKYKIAEITQGITIIHLHGSRLQEIFVKIPSDVKEQTAIATVLSDMDAEIKSLEQKRDKYIMLKQGMMQQLLTGKIRIYANN